MRNIYKNFISEEEALSMSKGEVSKVKIIDTKDEFIKKVLNKIKEDFDFTVNENSYYAIEHRPLGHGWHKDTGTSNHMMWCQVGISILLKEGDSGGETYYADDDKETNKIKSNRKLYDLVAHTSDEWHMVTQHTGKRVVFLMFI
jgi:hypothetical protein